MTDMEKMAKDNEILRVVNGSHLYGTATETSDRDEIGVCIQDPRTLIGFQNFEQFEFKTAGDHIRNTADDYDLTIYDARKFARLVTDGNPSLLNLLWVPEDKRLAWSPWADSLMQIREHVHSRVAIGKFLGYMNAQIKRMKGEEKKHTPNRPELVEKFGYDTKFAGHAIRLGYQGLEFALHGRITLPMPQPIRELVLEIRNGKASQEEVLEIADEYVLHLEYLKESPGIRKHPDRKAVEEIVFDIHSSYWHTKRLL